MSKSSHTPEERAALLAAVGAPAEAVEQAAAPEKPKRTRKDKTKENTSLEQDVSAVVASIAARAGADREAALDMVDKHVQSIFDANKVSKIEAAQRGIESSNHNRALWTSVQTLRTQLKTAVRKQYAGTIAAKVRKTSAVAQEKRDAVTDEDMERFLASESFKAMFAEWKAGEDQSNGQGEA